MAFRCYKLVKVFKTNFQLTQNESLGVSDDNDQTHPPCLRRSPDRSFHVLLAVDGTLSRLYTDLQPTVVQRFPEQYGRH